MIKYAGIIIAILIAVLAVLAGVFHVLPNSEVSTVVQDVVLYILGHLVGLGSAIVSPMLRRGRRFS